MEKTSIALIQVSILHSHFKHHTFFGLKLKSLLLCLDYCQVLYELISYVARGLLELDEAKQVLTQIVGVRCKRILNISNDKK